MKTRRAVSTLGFALACGAVLAAAPPALVNYQGVLRDAAGVPIDGTRDMVLRLYDAPAGGNEVVVDEHLASGTGSVVVDGGLFNVAIGGGDVADGAGPGTYSTLGQVFRRLKSVYLEIQVAGEVLVPRIRVLSAAYALDDATVDPPCYSASNRFTDCGNGTVTDAVTGLVWLKTVNCSAFFGSSKTYVQANSTVAQLGDGQCGLTDASQPGDWRLPSRGEIEVLINLAVASGCGSPFLPDQTGLGCCGTGTCSFTSVSTDIGYWSATSVDTNPANAWYYNLGPGTHVTSLFKGVGEHVWAVRSAP
jgi:hypothetical protein